MALKSESDDTATGQSGGATALNTVMQWPGIRLDELAAILDMSHSGTVRVADRLVKRGLILRAAHPSDARAVGLSVTERGQAIADTVQRQRLRVLERLVTTLPKRAQTRLASTIEELLRILADEPAAADRICRLCEERICTLSLCPTEDWVRRQEQRKQWRSGTV
jgi:DNA-binding MarR family transcriptional regulator